MAAPPRIAGLSREDFPDAPRYVDRLLPPLNEALRGSAEALTRALTFRENIQSQIFALEIAMPPADLVLATGWSVNGDDSFDREPRLFRLADGRVQAMGFVVGPAAGPSTIFTAPSAYRPARTVPLGGTDANNAFASGRMSSNGALSMQAGNASSWLSLAGWQPWTPATPPPPFPLQLPLTMPRPLTDLFITSVRCTTRGASTPPVVGLPRWEQVDRKTMRLLDIPGLQPGKSYAVRMIGLAEG